jgi:ABC-type transport system involved in multi-copper enzyme maturation permease subunit
MTAKNTRILKEARPLFWPWCAVALAGAVPLVRPLHSLEWISPIGLFLGIPLLATLSLGNEFQHRTLSLLLSQPVGRMEIWGEKMSVTLVAVLSAVLVFSLSLRAAPFQPDPQNLALAGAWIIATIASATFWTLFTRSTLGGVALNIAVLLFIIIALNIAYWLSGLLYLSMAYAIIVPTGTFVFLCYAGAMFWLGRRTLARFQATGGTAGDDLLMAGPDVMPVALAGWFHCRPTGAVLNLIRKEFRLLRPVWIITLLYVLGWTCVTLFRMVPERGSNKEFPVVGAMLIVFSTLIAVLAGSLSLGEEKTSGTHAWQLTLPVSARRQWFIKLCMALFAGLVGAALLPILVLIAGGFLFGSPFLFVDPQTGMVWWLLGVSLLTFAAFWCACAVNGTVRAVLWVFPVMIALGFAGNFGNRVAHELVDFVFSSRFNPFANFRFAWAVARVVNGHFRLLSLLVAPMMYATLVGGPVLLLALVQSYRLFRAQFQGSTRTVVRNLLPLAMLVFLCGVSLTAFNSSLQRGGGEVSMLVAATSRAIQKTLPAAAKLDATRPLQLTDDDVARAFPFPLPEGTRRWLRNARITVTSDKAHPSGFYCVEDPRWSTYCYYSATIHLADGTNLTELHEPMKDRELPFGRYSVYVHWPGAKGQESLWDR